MKNLNKHILAISSSRAGDSAYLAPALPTIKNFLGSNPLQIAFIPFAIANNDYTGYTHTVEEGLKSLPHSIVTVLPETAREILQQSDVIMAGGGNTFKLMHDIYELKLLELIRNKVSSGMPYIGWSAGANILAPGIGTTNDMPVIEPESFKALGLFPFQINPHYTNAHPPGHRGETRDDRLAEFVLLNPGLTVVGLPEGTALQLLHGNLTLIGDLPAVLFSKGPEGMIKKEVAPGEPLNFLL